MSFVQIGSAVHHYVWRPAAASGLASEAVTLVFLNALGTDLRIWDEVVAALPQSWSVLRYDQRGQGLSEIGDTPHSVAGLAADVSELLDELGLSKVVLCGLSLGGLVAQELVLARPERVRAVCLCGTAARIGTRESWDERSERVRSGGMAAIADSVLARWFSEPFLRSASARGYRTLLERTSPAAYLAAVAALRDADLSARVGAIQAPVLVLAGELDEATPPALSRALCEALPAARCELIPKASHLMCVEQPAAVARALVSFITGLAPGPDVAAVDDVFERGMRVRRAVLGNAHVDRAERAAGELDRDFQHYVTRAAWGEVWARPGLPLATRHLLTLALLAAQNRQQELALHVAATRNTGVTPEQLREALLHVAVYAGVPAAHAAFETTKRALYGES